MKRFSATQNFTVLSDLMRLFSDADEIVYRSFCDLEPDEIAMLCRDARRLASHVRLRNPGRKMADIVRDYGVSVRREEWETAGILFFAECEMSPPLIRLNTGTISALAGLMRLWAPESDLHWFSDETISEVATAHELSHILDPARPSKTRELHAHAFAREATGLPFSPLLYDDLLQRMSKGSEPFRR